jgi:hypothetical protein
VLFPVFGKYSNMLPLINTVFHYIFQSVQPCVLLFSLMCFSMAIYIAG